MLNKTAQTIKNRLSLREPQAKSLEILTTLADTLSLRNTADITSERDAVKALHPTTFSDFERDFPSVTFSLATGVGKTRLMGAFISYLYIEKGIKNFFMIAPGNTIYNKLIDDLSNPSSPKYVFHGISEFAVTPPKIITGENYNDSLTGNIFGETIRINIFNIQKISSEMRGGREPRIKRLSEYLGESYFDYLSGLDDLVVLMDESHHYRAAAGMKAINELKAVLGLELTATPIDSRGEKFKNVVFEYSLAHGLRDGFLKEPAVATRRDFNPDQYRNDPKELDLIKLEDGLRIHEDTKVELDIYARNTNNKRVKPFVLVVARDTKHASEIRELIESDRFFEGRYKGKVLEVTSNTIGKAENNDTVISELLSVEEPDNKIEIVIHVYMLKEGWDVTNLYTIIPLNAAVAQILTEQTMGRGLRLPYGKRTGVAKVDTLTIIAHDKFQAIVDAANAEGSIIKRENIIEIDPVSLPVEQSVVTATSLMDADLIEKRKAIAEMSNEGERKDAERVIEAKQAVMHAVGALGDRIKNIDDLETEEIKKVVFEQLKTDIQNRTQGDLFADELIKVAEEQYQEVVRDVIEKVIPIPRILIQQAGEVKSGFHHFDLDTSSLDYQPVSEEIYRRTLRTNQDDNIVSTGAGVARDTPVNIIVNELINYAEVDYDQTSDLLYSLANVAVFKLRQGKSEEDVENIILYYKKQIASFIYAQLKNHFYIEEGEFEEPVIHPFTKIEPHNFSMYTKDKVHHYTETIEPTNAIPSKVFGGFTKACHTLYKFDSKAEKDFATILENDTAVRKWLRPARAQFTIYWDHNSKRYEPDFVVESADTIYMVEVKAERNTEDADVKEKARAALKYCEGATKFSADNRGKKWTYILLPHNEVALNRSFEVLMRDYQFKDSNN